MTKTSKARPYKVIFEFTNGIKGVRNFRCIEEAEMAAERQCKIIAPDGSTCTVEVAYRPTGVVA